MMTLDERQRHIFCTCGHTMEVHAEGDTHECLDLIDDDETFCACQNFVFARKESDHE